MSPIEPLPFRISLPDKDVLDFSGFRSISYKIEGLLRLTDDTLLFEWSAIQTTERVALTGIDSVVDESPVGTHEIPLGWIARVRLRGGWLSPRLVLRGQRLDAFDGVPGGKLGVLSLRIGRQFRQQAKEMAAAIERAREEAPLPPPKQHTELEGGDDD